MSDTKKVKLGFDCRGLEIPIDSILPIRQIKPSDGCFGKYRAILASIRAIGLVEPLMVYPNKGTKGSYLLLDGHMRLKALQEIGHTTAPCLISTSDDAFTYNDKVSRLSLIQEHRMIMKALEGGVSEEDIAKALDIDVKKVIQRKGLLDDLHLEVINLLKDKPVTEHALRMLKRVKPLRQIEMAQLMVSANNFTFSYARVLYMGTPQDQLLNPEQPKRAKGLPAEDVARMEQEMKNLERNFRLSQDSYGENALHLNTAQRYVRRLLNNGKVKRFLGQRYPEILEELQELADLEAI